MLNKVACAFLLAVIFSSYSFTIADIVQVDDCNNGIAVPARVDISGCTEKPCIFYKESEISMNMTFESDDDYEHLFGSVIATIGQVDIPYPITNGKICEHLVDSRCPIERGEIVTYNFMMHISKYIPDVDLVRVTFRVSKSFLTTPMLCFKVDIKVRTLSRQNTFQID